MARSSTTGNPQTNPRKLTDEQAREIIWFLKRNGNLRAKAGYKRLSRGLLTGLAKHYRVDVETIRCIKRRTRYKHIKRRRIKVDKWRR